MTVAGMRVASMMYTPSLAHIQHLILSRPQCDMSTAGDLNLSLNVNRRGRAIRQSSIKPGQPCCIRGKTKAIQPL